MNFSILNPPPPKPPILGYRFLGVWLCVGGGQNFFAYCSCVWIHTYPPPPVSNEHCVQRTLPVRTVFFGDLINSVLN